MNQAGPRMYPGFIPLMSQASVWYDGQDLNKVSYSGGLCSRFCASSRGKLTDKGQPGVPCASPGGELLPGAGPHRELKASSLLLHAGI